MDSTTLRAKHAQLTAASNEILAKAHKAGLEVLPADEYQIWERMVDEADGVMKHAEALERQELMTKRVEAPHPRVTEPSVPTGRSSRAIAQYAETAQEDSDRAFRLWLLGHPMSGYQYTPEDRALCERMGISPYSNQLEIRMRRRPIQSLAPSAVSAWEARALATTPGSVGGFTIPDETMRALEIALLTFGGMRQRSTIIRTSTGAALPIPTVNDTANVGEIIGENAQINEQDVAFGQVVLDSFKYSSKMVRVSVEFLQDSATPVGELLGKLLGERIGRKQNTDFTVGTGTGMPRGIVPAATVGVTATTGSATSVTYANLVALEHSVDIAYRTNAAFMMSDAAFRAIKQLVDTTGRPLWAPSIAVGEPATLLGYPLVVNNDVPVMAANAKSIVFGDLSAYWVRDVLGITLVRSEERYMEFHQVAFAAFARADGDLIDAGTHPVKVYVNSAT